MSANNSPFIVNSRKQHVSSDSSSSYRKYGANTPARGRAFSVDPLGASRKNNVSTIAFELAKSSHRSDDARTPAAGVLRAAIAEPGALSAPTSQGTKNAEIRLQPAGGVTTARGGGRRRSSVTRSSVSRRGSTMKEMLEQKRLQEQTSQPLGDRYSSIHSERQARRPLSLHLGLPGGFVGMRAKKAKDLFRGIPVLPGHALCSGDDSFGASRNYLWESSMGSERDFLLSKPVAKVDWFVSHTWARDRRDQMFRNTTEFTVFKAVELRTVVEDIAEERRSSRRELPSYSRLDEMLNKVPVEPLMLWIDKFCVPQDNLERRLVIENHMGYFLNNSDGLLVLLSACYFQRIWCVYEWGCFIAAHGVGTLDRIRVGLSWLCCSATFQVPLVANDLEHLHIPSLKCSELNDQLFLRSEIVAKYRSVEAFEQMVKVSALCCLAKCCAIYAADFCTAGHSELEEAWRVFDRHLEWRRTKFLVPWRSAAEKLGFAEICTGLDSFWDLMQRSTKLSADAGKVDDLFCISAPPKARLRIIASSAAQMHLASIVRKARGVAVVDEAVGGEAGAGAGFANAATVTQAATARQRSRRGKSILKPGGAISFEEEEEDDRQAGSSSSGDEEDGTFERGMTLPSFESEAGW